MPRPKISGNTTIEMTNKRGRQHEQRALALLAADQHLRPAQADGPEDVGVEHRPPCPKAEIDPADPVGACSKRHENQRRERPQISALPKAWRAVGNVIRRHDVEKIAFAIAH